MTEKPNFVLIPDDAPPPAPARTDGLLARLKTLATTAVTAAAAALPASSHAEPPVEAGTPGGPRLIFAVDATASREPAWTAARQVTDALVKALPGELDVALAVHGGSRVHTFTTFTKERRHASRPCRGGFVPGRFDQAASDLLASLKHQAVRVVVYIGDVFEESFDTGPPDSRRPWARRAPS